MVFVAVLALAVAVTRDPIKQIIVLGPFSIGLIAMFAVLQAPDVVLSEIAIGVVAYPAMVLLVLAKTKKRSE
jgi:uncharacterized MnhB-related membrane protein